MCIRVHYTTSYNIPLTYYITSMSSESDSSELDSSVSPSSGPEGKGNSIMFIKQFGPLL